jgi:hypothetical protein
MTDRGGGISECIDKRLLSKKGKVNINNSYEKPHYKWDQRLGTEYKEAKQIYYYFHVYIVISMIN